MTVKLRHPLLKDS